MKFGGNRGFRGFIEKLEHEIISKTPVTHLRRFGVHYSVCIASFTFCLGLWKIRNDLATVFTDAHSKTDAWVKIIEGTEVLVFLLMIARVTVEKIAKSTNRSKQMDAVQCIREYSGEPMDARTPTLLYAVFYGSLTSVLTFQVIFEKRSLDYERFLLITIGQFYLISTELDFVSKVLNVANSYKTLNRKLSARLRGVSVPVLYWFGIKSADFTTTLELKDFSNTHWSICKYVDAINQTHGLRLFSIIVCIFYKLTFIPYLLVLNLSNAYSETLMKELTNAGLLCFHLAELLLLALTADSATREVCNRIRQAERTRIILCEYLKIDLQEEDINDIELFLGHFSVHKAEFRISSLFVLDRPFVITMFGAVTTYTIIFIQLQDALNVTQLFSNF